MNCPKCGAAARGKFCPKCGTALETARCATCQAKLEPGARFCTQCGARVRGAGVTNTAWYIAGAVILALIVVLLLFPFRTRPLPQLIGSEPTGGAVRSATPPPLSANMREN